MQLFNKSENNDDKNKRLQSGIKQMENLYESGQLTINDKTENIVSADIDRSGIKLETENNIVKVELGNG